MMDCNVNSMMLVAAQIVAHLQPLFGKHSISLLHVLLNAIQSLIFEYSVSFKSIWSQFFIDNHFYGQKVIVLL